MEQTETKWVKCQTLNLVAYIITIDTQIVKLQQSAEYLCSRYPYFAKTLISALSLHTPTCKSLLVQHFHHSVHGYFLFTTFKEAMWYMFNYYNKNNEPKRVELPGTLTKHDMAQDRPNVAKP